MKINKKKMLKYPKFKSLKFKVLILSAIAVVGLLVFFLQKNQFLQKNNNIPVAPLQLDDKTSIQFPYTDDNSGENIIIKTDKKDYYGINSSDVYVSITNTRNVAEKAVLLFYFPKPEEGVKDDKLIPRVDTLEQYGDSNSKWKFITFFKENIKINPKLLSIGLKKREAIPQTLAINIGAEIDIPANQTIYFKSKIKYPEGSQGEFWIETIGTQGGYGLLDPTYFGTTVSTDTKPGWYDPFTYRKKFTVPAKKVSGGSNLSNFPVLISHTDPDIRITSFGGKAASGSGEFIFTSSDGTTSIPYEIETYSSSSGQFIGWVNVTTLSATVDTDIYMYYGGAAAGAATNQNKTGTWNSNYVAVLHLGNGQTLNTKDSTSNAHGFTQGSAAAGGGTDLTAGSGTIDGGAAGGNSNKWGFINYADDINIDTLTISFWIKTTETTSGNTFVGKANTSAYTAYPYNILLNGSNIGFEESDGTVIKSTTSINNNIWYYYTGTRSGPTGTITTYVNSKAEATGTGSSGLTQTTQGVAIMGRFDSIWTDGSVDEIRISNIGGTTGQASAGWIATEYNNQVSPRTFYTIGAEQNRNPSTMRYGTTVSSDTKPNWYISGSTPWKNRIKITVPSKVVSGGSDLSSFPMLLSFTESDIKTTSFGGKSASGSGEFIFTSSDGTTSIPYEIETYSSSSGQFIGWVNVTTLSATVDTDIYMYYGGAAAGAATNQNKTGVWDTNYQGVYHLGDGDSTVANFYKDSTSNARNGQLTDADGDTTQANGKIGSAMNFNGDADYISLADNAFGNLGDSITVSAWINIDVSTSQNNIVSEFESGVCGDFIMVTNTSAKFRVNDGGAQSINSNKTLSINIWYYTTFVSDATLGYLYIDNALDNTHTTDLNWNNGCTTQNVIIASNVGVEAPMNGRIDELRVSNTNRSSGWIATEYNNQVSPRTFYTIGRPESMTVSGNSGNEAPGSIKTK